MKKFTYSVAIAATLLASANTFAQQGFGTNTPHRSSAVEIKSSNKGLLIPRVTLSNETDVLTIASPAHSLLVFHQGAQVDKASTLTAGYYYWDAEYKATPTSVVTPKWVAFSTAEGATYTSSNGITKTPGQNNFELGGVLIKPNTEITATAQTWGSLEPNNPSSPQGYTGGNTFAIKGLNTATTIFDSENSRYVFNTGEQYKVLVQSEATGILRNVSLGDIVGAGLSVKNGLNIQNDPTGANKIIKLGGDITEPTNLNIVGDNTVSVTGLKYLDATQGEETNTNSATVTPISATTAWDPSVDALGGNLVPIGGSTDGVLKVTSAKEIVDAGIVSINHTIVENVTGAPATDKHLVTTINGVDVSNAINLSDIVSSGFTANNGLTKTDDLVQLGGDLMQNTTIDTKNFNLAINNLQNTSTGNKRVLIERVSEEIDGTTVTHDVLRTVERNITVEGLTEPTNAVNYEEITYIVTTGGNLALPAASAKGQVINVIINENLSGLLFINGAGDALVSADLTAAGITGASVNTLAYGEMLGQRFTLKSDGTNWIITSRM